jgi:hypothetical protein
LVLHGSLQEPLKPGWPVQVCPKPHCDDSVQVTLPPLTRASADTWKSLKTTRPH